MYQGLIINDISHFQLTSHIAFCNHFSHIKFKCVAQQHKTLASLLTDDKFSIYIINTDEMTKEHIKICQSIRLITVAPIVIISEKSSYHMMKEAAHCHVNDVLSGNITLDDIINCLQVILNDTQLNSSHKVTTSFELNTDQSECVIEQIKLFIHSELHKQITLKQLSKQLHFNYAYLGQKFKHKLNISFNEYLLQQRMEKAKQLLISTDMKIYEIAQRVGYTEIDWFYKKFKEYTGVSANEYRKQLDYSYAN